MQTAFTCIMGIVTVFAGLIALIAITMAMSAIINRISKPKAKEANSETKGALVSKAVPIANKQEIIAGVCAVIAEELGTDVSNIKVVSFKKL